MDATRTCPDCAEPVRPEARRCPHCRSWLAGVDPGAWHRDRPERRLAGVAAATSRGLGVSLAAVRIGFLVLTFFHLLGPVLYGALWVLVPFRPGDPSLLERGVTRLRRLWHETRAENGPAMPPESQA